MRKSQTESFSVFIPCLNLGSEQRSLVERAERIQVLKQKDSLCMDGCAEHSFKSRRVILKETKVLSGSGQCPSSECHCSSSHFLCLTQTWVRDTRRDRPEWAVPEIWSMERGRSSEKRAMKESVKWRMIFNIKKRLASTLKIIPLYCSHLAGSVSCDGLWISFCSQSGMTHSHRSNGK